MEADDKHEIEELKEQVGQLKEIVRDLLDERISEGPHWDSFLTHFPSHIADLIRAPWVRDIQKDVDLALHGDEGETIEEHIGGVWLSRAAVLMILTALVIAAGITVGSDQLAAPVKFYLGYGLSALALLAGIASGRRRNIFIETSLGAGLSGVYFCTYALFYVPAMRLFHGHPWAVPALAGVAVLIALAVHLRKSQMAASMAVVLIFYTVMDSYGDASLVNIDYVLSILVLLIVVVFVLHIAHRWTGLACCSLLASYATYVFFLRTQPLSLVMEPAQYQWIASAYLALCFTAFSVASIAGERNREAASRPVFLMVLLNALAFLGLMWNQIAALPPGRECLTIFILAASMMVLAVTARKVGHGARHLCHLFVAACVILTSLALKSILPYEWFVVTLALQGLVIAAFYGMTGMSLFRALNLVTLAIVFFASLGAVRMTSPVYGVGMGLPVNWFCCVAAAGVFYATAWYYERLVRLVNRKKEMPITAHANHGLRDIHNSTVAVLHAAAASLLILTLTIMEFGENPQLPYIIAAQSVVLAAFGFLLCTPQIEVGSVLLLVAAHVCFHAFRLLDPKIEFIAQENYAIYTILLALFTYFGAYLWERYLHRIKEGYEWEHHVVAGIPYVAATYLLTTLMAGELPSVYAPVAQNLLGAVLLGYGCLRGYTSVKVSGVTAMAAGSISLLQGLVPIASPMTGHPHFIYGLLAALAGYALAERFLLRVAPRGRRTAVVQDILRGLCIVASSLFGLYGLYRWSHGGYLTLFWLGHGLMGMLLGAMFRERWYRWAALLVFAFTSLRAFRHDLQALEAEYQVLVFAVLGAVLLLTSLLYSHYRSKHKASRDAKPSEEQAPS